jgi:hypothetical protein
MTIDQILCQIDTERVVGSRFPVRLIFVEHFGQYEDLVSRLASVCDVTINLSDENICSGADIYPDFRKLHDKLSQYNGKHIMLLSVGEFLRFRIRREIIPSEAKFPSLWQLQQSAASKTRVFVPMFACRDLFERIVPQIDDRQRDYIWTLDAPPGVRQPYSISVFSPAFSEVISSPIKGIREWLMRWQDEYRKNEPIEIVTALYSNIEKTNGEINIAVIDNTFDYLCSLVSDGYRLKKEWGTDALWAELIPYIVHSHPFNKTIEAVLNIKTFSSVAVMAMWDTLSSLQHQLVWMWYRLNDSDDYCGYVFRHTENVDSIKVNLRDEIIRCVRKPEWIDERNGLLSALKNVVFDDKYFALLDTLPLYDMRLQLLTYNSHEERTYAIKTISHWLRQGASVEGILEALDGHYPLLEQYLSGDIVGNPGLTSYFSWYRYHKITNCIPATAPASVDLEAYPSRYSLLSQYQGKDSVSLWIDGMGIEWLPLLQTQLEKSQDFASVSIQIAAALLPTETEYNEQWNDLDYPHEKWNRLDLLAHKGNPDDKDYFSCIANQLLIIADVARKAISMLHEHDYVIITADHGSSRIAALYFHNTPGIPAPKGAIVRSYGRFCELHKPASVTDMLPCTRIAKNGGKEYMIMTTHEHYAMSGNAAGGNDENKAVSGEIHGGMTPEEYLVPVVVLKRRIPLAPLDYSLKTNTVFRNKETTKIELHFNRDVATLEAMADTVQGSCVQKSPQEWEVSFGGLDTREYTLEIIANKRLVQRKETIFVKSKGISKNDDPFRGL